MEDASFSYKSTDVFLWDFKPPHAGIKISSDVGRRQWGEKLNVTDSPLTDTRP